MGGSAEALAEQGRWTDVRLLLGAVDPDELGPEEHELLAVASGLTEHDECEVCWERAHVAWLELGELRRAARCAFWLGMFLVDRRRQVAPAMGWLQCWTDDLEMLVASDPQRIEGVPLLVDGNLVGTWRSRKKPRALEVTVEGFRPLSAVAQQAVVHEAQSLAVIRDRDVAAVDFVDQQ